MAVSYIEKYLAHIVCVFISILVISSSAKAQSRPWNNGNPAIANTNNEPVDNRNSNAGVFSLGGGIGFSTIDLRIYGFGTEYVIHTTPAYNAFVDYGINTNICIGLAFTYQSVTAQPYSGGGGTEYITRYNTGFRILKYRSVASNSSFYYGGRIGISYWTDNFSNLNNNGVPYLGASTRYSPSIQLFCGYRILLINNIAFHIEGGIGAPYLIQAGLSFRI